MNRYVLMVFLLLSLLFSTNKTFSQYSLANRPDSIYLLKKGYYRNGQLLVGKDLAQLLLDNEASKDLFIQSKKSIKAADVIGTIGGLCLGFYAGYYLTSRKSLTGCLIAGGLGILISIPLNIRFIAKRKQAVKKFNRTP